MKIYPIQFNRFLYYEHLKIAHLFDIMHIEKNVTKKLWRIVDGKSDKEKIVKICTDIQEANHALQNVIYSNINRAPRNNIPWFFTKQERNIVKEVI
jgi:hypothetical protein